MVKIGQFKTKCKATESYSTKTANITARTPPRTLNSITVAGSKLIRSLSPTSFEPVCDQLRTSFEPDSVMELGFEPVCDQLRISLEPASVMGFGFYPPICHITSLVRPLPAKLCGKLVDVSAPLLLLE